VIDEKTRTEYLKKSYFAVDGLWFVHCEEELGHAKALDLDRRIWRVLPKIQARRACELLGLERKGWADFHRALDLKLDAEGYGCLLDGPRLEIWRCPWLDILREAGRESVAGEIGREVCLTEFTVWFREFFQGRGGLRPGSMMCLGESRCTLFFEENPG